MHNNQSWEVTSSLYIPKISLGQKQVRVNKLTSMVCSKGEGSVLNEAHCRLYKVILNERCYTYKYNLYDSLNLVVYGALIWVLNTTFLLFTSCNRASLFMSEMVKDMEELDELYIEAKQIHKKKRLREVINE